MKSTHIFLILALLLFNEIAEAQNCRLTPEMKQEIIDSLYSSNWYERSESVDIIIECEIVEAKEPLEDNFWQLGPTNIVLRALYQLGSDKTYNYALSYYDTIEVEIEQLNWQADSAFANWQKRSLLDEQVGAIEFLFHNNDYSKADKVIELLNYYNEEPKDMTAMSLLKYLVENVPRYSERAHNELVQAVSSNAYTGLDRLSIFHDLYDVYKDETFPIARDLFLNDSDFAVRMSIVQFLPIYKNENIPEFLIHRLNTEQDTIVFNFMVEQLLKRYCSPAIYVSLKESAKSLSNPAFSEYILSEIKYFEPVEPSPNSNLHLSTMLDSLGSYIHQCLAYNWIDRTFSNELDSLIQNSMHYLGLQDSINCAKQIRKIQGQADYEFKDSANITSKFITKEGWQFLYHYSTYILERLPEITDNLNFNIKLLNSQGALLTGGSLQYYEGKLKDAVNCDGTFLCKMLYLF